MRTLKAALVQRAALGRPAEDLDACVAAARRGAAAGCRLVLLQELHNGRYFCQREEPRVFDAAFEHLIAEAKLAA